MTARAKASRWRCPPGPEGEHGLLGQLGRGQVGGEAVLAVADLRQQLPSGPGQRLRGVQPLGQPGGGPAEHLPDLGLGAGQPVEVPAGRLHALKRRSPRPSAPDSVHARRGAFEVGGQAISLSVGVRQQTPDLLGLGRDRASPFLYDLVRCGQHGGYGIIDVLGRLPYPLRRTRQRRSGRFQLRHRSQLRPGRRPPARTGLPQPGDRLVKAGLVLREPSMEDRRVKRVVLTAAGNRVLDTVKTVAAAIRKELLAGIQPEKLESATELLEQLQGMFDAGP